MLGHIDTGDTVALEEAFTVQATPDTFVRLAQLLSGAVSAAFPNGATGSPQARYVLLALLRITASNLQRFGQLKGAAPSGEALSDALRTIHQCVMDTIAECNKPQPQFDGEVAPAFAGFEDKSAQALRDAAWTAFSVGLGAFACGAVVCGGAGGGFVPGLTDLFALAQTLCRATVCRRDRWCLTYWSQAPAPTRPAWTYCSAISPSAVTSRTSWSQTRPPAVTRMRKTPPRSTSSC